MRKTNLLARALLVVPLMLAVAACNEQILEVEDEALAPSFDEADGHHSHWRYGHLTWIPRPDIGPRTVEFTYHNAFRRGFSCRAAGGSLVFVPCTGPGGGAGIGDIIREDIGVTPLNFGDGAGTGTLWYVVTSIDVAANWLFAVALDPGTSNPNIIHTYGGAGTTFDANSFRCCRIGGLNNPGSGYGVQTRVTLGTGNRSPVSNIVPIVNVLQGGVQTWFVPAADADADLLSWRLSTIAEATGTALGAQPAGLSINPGTGLVSWNTTGKALGLYWTQKTIEELNADGSLKGRVAIDYLINVVGFVPGNTPPVFTNVAPACGATVPVNAGSAISFTVSASDVDAGNTISLGVVGLPPGATSPIPPPGNPVSSTFNWTPGAGDAGPHVITYSATDNFGAQALCPVTVNVITNQPPVADAGPDQDHVEWTSGGTSVTLDGTGSSDPDGDPLTYTWTDAGGTLVGTGATPTITLNSLGTHTITLTVSDGSATSSDAVDITVEDTTAPTVSVTATPSSLWPPNHKYHTIDLSGIVVSDECDPDPTVEVWIESDEPDNAIGNGDGNTTGDIRVTLADGTVFESSNASPSVHFDADDLDELELRAERAGGGDGRTYTITVMATDSSGNSTTTTTTVTVAHDQS